jgi:hypothetical protein
MQNIKFKISEDSFNLLFSQKNSVIEYNQNAEELLKYGLVSWVDGVLKLTSFGNEVIYVDVPVYKTLLNELFRLIEQIPYNRSDEHSDLVDKKLLDVIDILGENDVDVFDAKHLIAWYRSPEYMNLED